MINQKGLLSYVLKSRIYHTYEDAIFVIVNLSFLNSNTHLLLRIACSHYTDFIFLASSMILPIASYSILLIFFLV